MSLADLGNIGEFVGAIAVVASLVYLALQIRQNTRQLDHNSEVVSANVELDNALYNVITLARNTGTTFSTCDVLCDKRVNVFLFCHVARNCDSLAARILDCGQRCLSFFLVVEVVDDDLGTLLGQRDRSSSTNVTTTTCNNGNFSFERFHYVFLCYWH